MIVIVLESVGTQYLSLYGSGYNTTPTLVEEAAHAVVFDNFYAHVPYTFCSFMALNFLDLPGHAVELRAWRRLWPRRRAPAATDACLRC